ncbi:hypothetical protein [Streptomyces sp. CC224B]|uniref:hypothetical protein n=1 Tax=Streptomyces sp. CC224B TaxID=3044571 RepID=UPI0024A97857|nr:hypothetical protein [Streptomyces sp. CC224B]
MTAVVPVPLPPVEDGEHPLVAVLGIFAPGAAGVTGTAGGAERQRADDADPLPYDANSVPYEAITRRLARLGLS